MEEEHGNLFFLTRLVEGRQIFSLEREGMSSCDVEVPRNGFSRSTDATGTGTVRYGLLGLVPDPRTTAGILGGLCFRSLAGC